MNTAVQADSDIEADLYVVEWQASAWGEMVAGTACWLLGVESALRAEVSRDVSAGSVDLTERLRRLLHRQGEGWTVTWAGGEEGTGTWQPWGEEWRVAEPRLMIWLRILTTALLQGPALALAEEMREAELVPQPRRAANRPRWLSRRSAAELSVDKLHVQIPSPPAQGWNPAAKAPQKHSLTPFQAAMVQRGLGRGANQEIVTLHWESREAETGPDWLRISSSRRSGQLKITLPQAILISYPAIESFLPLWSLAELAVEIPAGVPWEKK